MITSLINQPAPSLSVFAWVQGDVGASDSFLGKVVLIEVFQVNCPGCFLYSLPEAIRLHERYAASGLVVLGVATAFEDFDKNNLENLQRLINNGEVVGETLKALNQQARLIGNRLSYRLPFPVAMDRLTKPQGKVTDGDIHLFITGKLPDYPQYPESRQRKLYQQVKQYLEALEYHAETFERFQLQGTPSQLLVDKQGFLRKSVFGAYPELESDIQAFLQE